MQTIRKVIGLLWLPVLFVVLLATIPALANEVSTPLPLNLKISPATPDVPKSVATFSGIWTGHWEDTLASTLVVEKMGPSFASIVYSWGIASSWGINRPGFVRVAGKISDDGLLSATLRNGAEVIYRLTPDQQSLDAQYTINGRIALGTFRRAQQ